MQCGKPALGGAAGVLAVAAAACGTGGAPDPATREGDDAVRLWVVLLLIAVVIAVIVLGLFAYAAIRWRARGDDTGARVSHGRASLRIEMVYTLVPLVIVAGIFTYSTIIQVRADDERRADVDLTVDVTAFRWGWRFEYRGEHVEVVGNAPDKPLLVLPVDAVVRFELDAADVIHSIWVPQFFTKRDLIPGEHNTFTVETNRTGTFTGYCAEYCGLDHARMLFDVSVVTQDEFDRWLTANRQPG